MFTFIIIRYYYYIYVFERVCPVTCPFIKYPRPYVTKKVLVRHRVISLLSFYTFYFNFIINLLVV